MLSGSEVGEFSEAESRHAASVTPELTLDVSLEDMEDTTAGPNGTFRQLWTRACDQLSAFAGSPVARIRGKAARILSSNAAFAGARYYQQLPHDPFDPNPLVTPRSPQSPSGSMEEEKARLGSILSARERSLKHIDANGHYLSLSLDQSDTLYSYDDGEEDESDDNLWAYGKLLPILCDLAHDLDPTVRSAAADALRECVVALMPPPNSGIASMTLAALQIVVVSLLGVAAMLVSDNIESVRSAASKAIIEIVGRVDEHVVRESIISVLCRLSSVPHDPQGGGTEAAVVCGALAGHCSRDFFIQDVWPHFQELVHSRAPAVRKACAESLPAIGARLGPEMAEEMVIPLFVEYAKDPIWSVREACASTVLALADTVLPKVRDSVLLGIVCDLCRDSFRWVRMAAYEQYGKFLAYEDSEHITESLLAEYVKMADPKVTTKLGDSSMRYNCAFSMPGVLQALGPDRFKEVRETYVSLCADLQYTSRITLASSLPVVARLILPTNIDFEQQLVDILEGFLKDLEEVRLAALSRLSMMLPPLSVKQAVRVLRWIPELAHDDNWRVRKRIAKMLSDFARYCSEHDQEMLSALQKKGRRKNHSSGNDKLKAHQKPETFVDLCIALCEDPVWAVRQAAAKTVVSAIESLKDKEQRQQMYKTLCTQFGEAKVYSQRLLFVHICEFTCRRLGREHFRNSLLFPVFEKLGNDPVRFVSRAYDLLNTRISALPQRSSPKRKTEGQDETSRPSLSISPPSVAIP